MLGLTYHQFTNKFQDDFRLTENTLKYNSNNLYIKYYKNLDLYEIHDLFFRFSNQLDAFNYYIRFFENEVVENLCDIWLEIYKIIQHKKDVENIENKIKNLEKMVDEKYITIAYHKALKWHKSVNKMLYEIDEMNFYIKKFKLEKNNLIKLY